MNIAVHTGLAALAERYDGLIVDLWGVIHDGREPYPGVLDCLDRLRQAGHKVVLLSNAPRSAARVLAALGGMGITNERVDGLVTSGDVTLEALRRRNDAWHTALGHFFLHLGPARDWGLLQDTPHCEVVGLEEADFILVTGFYDDESECAADYRELFGAALRRRLPMVCANPDLSVMRGSRTVPCAGALAAAYEALGGEVRYHGKPHAGAYDVAVERLDGIARSRILVVGDSLRTDIAGARAAGIDALFVTGGLHADEFAPAPEPPAAEAVAALCRQVGQEPMAAVARFIW
ncbi:MAG: TIGR01459 family HAD-type hydrolase [Alphaproteobacteria bacterium]|jgi:HAD superfamily hydrolase (TIGR01459 family)|nr:TIGR01459 family HAD-type hydrolase [Alphaproteobacteria bacterium]HJP20226.1 TIGR01459 family HAD-type hydrolase [Alphaproteobacteria bacterium]